jgi:hypothetical protein
LARPLPGRFHANPTFLESWHGTCRAVRRPVPNSYRDKELSKKAISTYGLENRPTKNYPKTQLKESNSKKVIQKHVFKITQEETTQKVIQRSRFKRSLSL